MRADRDTDALYAGMRGRFGTAGARANGYRSEGYFRREQAHLHALMNPAAEVVLDACCGSGLMLQPLLAPGRTVFGLDFNAEACRAARANGFPVVRGDAYHMPFGDRSIDEIVNCQFFNQQDAAGVEAFVAEAARVLAPGGRLLLVWRNGAALIHRVAHALLTLVDRLRDQPEFPQVTHRLSAVAAAVTAAGLEIERREVSCPPLGWQSTRVDGYAARLIGASCILVARKPG